jgi:hypothetical protein
VNVSTLRDVAARLLSIASEIDDADFAAKLRIKAGEYLTHADFLERRAARRQGARNSETEIEKH